MIRKVFTISILLIAWVSSSFAQAVESPEITIDELKDHIYYLASEELGGRKPGTEGGKLAAEYIRENLEKSESIKLIGDEGFQPFEVVTSISLGETNTLSFNGKSYIVENDFMPLSMSSSTSVEAPVVFAGYGFNIDDEKTGWSDYADIDVKGKWVMILRGSPAAEDSVDIYDTYSPLTNKAYTAKDMGVAGVLFISGEKFDPEDELTELRYEQGMNPIGIPVLHIKREVADDMLKEYDVTVAALENQLIEMRAPNSFEIESQLKAEIKVVKNDASTQNIIAVVEGSDPVLKNEYILIGAHYDHLGLGGPGSGSREPDTVAIHYGADDNASGTAAIMEIFEKLAANRDKLKRSVIYMSFAAEEMGLLGSKYFTSNPILDLKTIRHMINLDMVGRLDPETKSFTVGGTGTAAGMKEIIDEYGEKYGLNIQQSPEGYGPSDHASFYAEDIPVLFFFTGIHDDYHTSRDVPELVNYDGEKMIADFAYELLLDLANREEYLAYQDAGPKQPESRGTRFKVTLGIMPDVAGTTEFGLKADAVIEGKPAAMSGMQKGDIIISIEGKPVKDIYEYMNRLSELKEGDRINVEVLRGDEKKILIVQL
ncbi:MAG: M20/M25/M40 family metallo-hydrolase [Melioribacteraceae bacterium]|nr:M20/M25/M40 family metallo-hydrolase [Melioribacteraceae bacterium]MCF8354226.1 M20/M25/M40 family metallo-hydrolase [Melioribacteraceae bacterium]MCF8392872.1 M20/M25/M40 family metallo-hydrolase [Melioribacteraceae bacterium]MCF8418642.1 M20/M25/M40 family metallo-hydrolase [Melioribacteraceae bacterium]